MHGTRSEYSGGLGRSKRQNRYDAPILRDRNGRHGAAPAVGRLVGGYGPAVLGIRR